VFSALEEGIKIFPINVIFKLRRFYDNDNCILDVEVLMLKVRVLGLV